MADKPAQQPPVNQPISIPLVDNTHAPFLYFDGAPNFGFNEGICNVTLEALRFTSDGNSVVKERITVAHLRMSFSAAQSLKAAIEGALLLAAPIVSEAKN